MKGVEECISRSIDIGLDEDGVGRKIVDFHVAVHPQNVDAVEQDLGRWEGHIGVTVRRCSRVDFSTTATHEHNRILLCVTQTSPSVRSEL